MKRLTRLVLLFFASLQLSSCQMGNALLQAPMRLINGIVSTAGRALHAENAPPKTMPMDQRDIKAAQHGLDGGPLLLKPKTDASVAQTR